MEYIQQLVGMPWERTGMHCWALVVQIQEDLYGRALPLMRESVPEREEHVRLLSQKAERYGWTESANPRHGCVVRMYRHGRDRGDLEHVGVWFDWDGGMVVHTDHPHGVVLDTMPILSARGWNCRYFIPVDVV